MTMPCLSVKRLGTLADIEVICRQKVMTQETPSPEEVGTWAVPCIGSLDRKNAELGFPALMCQGPS